VLLGSKNSLRASRQGSLETKGGGRGERKEDATKQKNKGGGRHTLGSGPKNERGNRAGHQRMKKKGKKKKGVDTEQAKTKRGEK